MIERFREPAGSDRADATYGQPFFGLGCEDGTDGAESLEKGACGLHRDSRYRREQRLGGESAGAGRLTLRIKGSISPSAPLAAVRQSVEPQCRILWILGAEYVDVLIHDGQERTAERARCNRSVVQIGTLDQQVGAWITPDESDLRPKPTLDKRQMEVPDRFSLNDASCSNEIVTGREVASLCQYPKFLEQPARKRAFVDVDNDPDRLTYHQPMSLHRQDAPNCANSFREARRK